MARTCEKPGRAVRFAAPSERPFARHWYTGVRFLDVIFERFSNAQKHRSRWSRRGWIRPGGPFWGAFGTPICAALVYWGAFFGRNFRTVFERAKTSISVEPCKTM